MSFWNKSKRKDPMFFYRRPFTGFGPLPLSPEEQNQANAEIAQFNTDKEIADLITLHPQDITFAATAKVLGIINTGSSINLNPIVVLSVEVTQQGQEPFQQEIRTVVNAAQPPRLGDTIQLGKSDRAPNRFLYMGIVPSI